MSHKPKPPVDSASARSASAAEKTSWILANVTWTNVLGFALVQTWTVLCIALPDPVTYGEPFLDLRWVSLLTAALCSLIAALHPKVGPAITLSTSTYAAVAGLAFVASLLGPVSVLLPAPASGIMLHVAAIGVGVGFSWLYLAWYRRFCRAHDMVGLAASAVASLCLIYPFANVLSTTQINPWVSSVTGSLLPVVAALLLRFGPAPTYRTVPDTEDIRRLGKDKTLLLLRLGLCLFTVIAVVETVRNHLLGGTAITFYAGIANLGGVALKFACALWLVSVFARRDPHGVSIAYRFALVLLLAVVLCLPILLHGNWHAHVLLDVASFFFQLVMLTVAYQTCIGMALRPSQLFGLTQAVWAAGSLAGIGVESLREGYGAELIQLLPFVLGMMASVAFLFVFTDRDCVKILASLPPAPRNPQLEDRAAALAQRSGISERELEVVLIVAKGRTAARIAKVLGLSPATVNSHIYHVYQKLGIHSRQELMDAIERERL